MECRILRDAVRKKVLWQRIFFAVLMIFWLFSIITNNRITILTVHLQKIKDKLGRRGNAGILHVRILYSLEMLISICH